MRIGLTRGTVHLQHFHLRAGLYLTVSRFQTRMQHVQNSERELEEKKEHCKPIPTFQDKTRQNILIHMFRCKRCQSIRERVGVAQIAQQLVGDCVGQLSTPSPSTTQHHPDNLIE